MKARIALALLIGMAVIGAFLAPVIGDETVFDSPLSTSIFMPFVSRNWRYGYEPDNLVCNPSAEFGEFCWTLAYPGTGNVLCGCDGEECPVPTDGDCEFRFGGWHDMVETSQSAPFYLSEGLTYHLSLDWQMRTDEEPLDAYDTLDLYLVVPGGYHHHLFSVTNLNLFVEVWTTFGISIGPGVSGEYSLLFVAITDPEKSPEWPGTTNFYIDNLLLAEWGDCKECVVCQLLDQPPETFCDQGHEDDCDGCCPGGDDCAGLDPQCPVLPPPHFYREIDRWTECYESTTFVVPIESMLDEFLEMEIKDVPGER